MYRHPLGIAFLAGTLLFAGLTANALAAGTPACDTISNQATLSYSVGGVSQTDIDSDGDAAPGTQTTDFKVATKINLTVSTVNSPKTAIGANQVLTYSITNTGNDTQRYGLQLYAGANTETYGAAVDAFNMNNVRVYIDTNATFVPALTDGETLIANPAATNGATLATLTSNVAADGVIYVHVVSDVPAGQAAGDDAIYTLKAKTYQVAGLNGSDGNLGTETGNSSTLGDLTENGCGPSTGVALADGDKDLTDSAVGGATDDPNDGDSYATGYYTVASADITVGKTSTVIWDPVNGTSSPIAIPGAYVRYDITVTNSATAGAPATLTTISDALVVALKIDPDLFTGADLDPSDGPYESAAGEGFKVTHAFVAPSTGRALASPLYYTTTSSADGLDHDGSPLGGTITATFATLLPGEAGPPVYLPGELLPGDSVTLTFNVIVQ